MGGRIDGQEQELGVTQDSERVDYNRKESCSDNRLAVREFEGQELLSI